MGERKEEKEEGGGEDIGEGEETQKVFYAVISDSRGNKSNS